MKVLMIGPTNLGPYHVARFREVTKLIPQFTYLRIFSKENFRPWSSNIEEVPCRIVTLQSNSHLKRILNELNPNITITIGYNSLILLKAAYWGKKHHIPTVLQCDSTFEDRPHSKCKELAKFLIVSRLYDTAFVAGERSCAYVKSLGIPENAIWYGVDVVDNGYFAASNKKWQPPETFPRQFFLTVTRLSPEKNLVRLLKAFEIYRDKRGAWGLVIVGTGPMEHELKEKTQNKFSNAVFWYGWADYKNLPSLYHRASCFILPSVSESWGLVVNEAMAAGLPVLVSQKCGCVPELCHTGINGFSFDPLNINELSELMLNLSSGELDLKSMGGASKRIISDYTPEIWAINTFKMCNVLLNRNAGNQYKVVKNESKILD